ncbi:Gfo/Idh/MocA family oxidoreductase [Simkania negevensis]|uniref:Gfo/Idh/MocA family oxidoreductase n=1 Tax=Simkania negevensis TaxID=83561 RepID=A0ABS3AT45_9BACT|nr:Gfo/Idh/MocA family oxidoreductase [Simkania negevensis]
MKTVRFAIVGCGRIAQRHAHHIIEHSFASLDATFDIKEEAAKQLAAGSSAKPFSSFSDLLKDPSIDIVNICTPNGTHHELATQSLKAGKHVLIEKPMAITKEECEDIISTAFSCDKKVFVVKQNRYNPPVQALKELVDEGRLGRLYFVSVNCFWNRNDQYYLSSDWKGTRLLDGGTLYTQFSHFVDVLYYLFGDIVSPKGVIKNVSHADLIEFEDTGSFVFHFKNGALGNFNYTTSSYKQNMEGSLTVFAEKGTIKIGGKYLNTIDYQLLEDFVIEDLPQSNPSNDYGYYEGSMSNHDRVIDNAVRALNGSEKIMTNAFDGMKVVEIIEKMYEAAGYSPRRSIGTGSQQQEAVVQ